MPNFIVTNVCNLSCPFCFATEHMDGERKGDAAKMSLDAFERQLAFVGDQVVRFCGGEPTLHPQIVDMMRAGLKRESGHIYLMTNGVWPRAVQEYVAGLGFFERRRVGFLFNVLPSSHYRPEQERTLHETLALVPKKYATLGVTLYERHTEIAHVFALAERFGIRRIRYSVASPNVTDPRTWLLDPTRDFPALASLVHELTMTARDRGLYVHSDCGYLPPCMFTEEQLRDLKPEADAFSCNGPVDIGPDGEAWRCYGLYSSMRANTADFSDSRALGEDFERRTNETEWTPLFDACATCEIKERYHCAGGCYALRSVQSMQTRAGEQLVQIGVDAALDRAMPRVRADRVHVGDVVMLRGEDGAWIKADADDADLLRRCNGEQTVATLTGGKRSAARAIRRLYDRRVIEFG